MALLRIARSDEYVNRIRDVRIILNGTVLSNIKNAETKDFEITPGKYVLQAKIDWCRSNKITLTIAENETKTLSLTSFAKHNPFGILATIYYITFGAGKYLDLKEIY